MPSAQNRATVEAKIRRLEGEIRQESERRRQEAEAAAAKAAAAAPAPKPVAKPVPAPEPTPAPVNPEDIVIPRAVPPTGSSTGAAPAEVYTPGPATAEPEAAEATYDNSNDPEFARVAAIDVAAIRDQRAAAGGGYSAARAPAGYDSEPVPARAGEPGGQMQGAEFGNADADKKKASKPIYKQWWFWVVAGVGAIILIDFATSDSSSSTNQRLIVTPPMQSGAPAPGGLEWRF
jgi:hypothetical protein